jgi:hypothetical protein
MAKTEADIKKEAETKTKEINEAADAAKKKITAQADADKSELETKTPGADASAITTEAEGKIKAIDAETATKIAEIDAQVTTDIAALASASSSLPLATTTTTVPAIPATGGKKGIQMNLDLTADMTEKGLFEKVIINKSLVQGNELDANPTPEKMLEVLNKPSLLTGGGARKSRKSRKTKRTKKGGKKRRSTKRSR